MSLADWMKLAGLAVVVVGALFIAVYVFAWMLNDVDPMGEE
jgi:hypothetical protein